MNALKKKSILRGGNVSWGKKLISETEKQQQQKKTNFTHEINQ